MYRAPTPREREQWHALWLLVQGWSASAVAGALGRDSHTIARTLLGIGGERERESALKAAVRFPRYAPALPHLKNAAGTVREA